MIKTFKTLTGFIKNYRFCAFRLKKHQFCLKMRFARFQTKLPIL